MERLHAKTAPLQLTFAGSMDASLGLPVWLTLQVFDIGYEEVAEPQVGSLPNGLVDGAIMAGVVLQDRRVCVWGALPILTYLGELHPRMWPEDVVARARARSVATEIAADFPSLRGAAASSAAASTPARFASHQLSAEIQRLQSMVTSLRKDAAEGQQRFLFGRFCLADAMVAGLICEPLLAALANDRICSGYFSELNGLPAMRALDPDAGPIAHADENPTDPIELMVDCEEAGEGDLRGEPAAAVVPPAPAAGPEPSPAPVEPPPKRRLEDVDRPRIAYLDDPKPQGWRSLPVAERFAAPPPIPLLPSRSGAPIGYLDDPPSERPGPMPAPVPESQVENQPAVRRNEPDPIPADDDDAFLFRLRRPGTIAGAERSAERGRPSSRLIRQPGQVAKPEDDPEPPRRGPSRPGTRPASIHPIGFTTPRRK